MKETKIMLGKLSAAHGVKGKFKFRPYSKNFFDEALNYKGLLFIEDIKIELTVLFKKNDTLVCFSNLFSSKEDLLKFIGKEIWINSFSLKKNSKDEYYHKDILNCSVFDKNHNELGVVKAVHNFGAGDLLELNSDFNYMIRFYDLKEENIRLIEKKIILDEEYQL